MYELRFSPQAEKYFRKIKEKPLKKAFQEALLTISEDPYDGSEKKGDLAGLYGWDVFYARTNYEIAYRKGRSYYLPPLKGSSYSFTLNLSKAISCFS